MPAALAGAAQQGVRTHRKQMEQLIPCAHCNAPISDSALKCPACGKTTGPKEALASKLAKTAGTTAALVAFGPAAIATALVVGPFMLDMDRQLKAIAKKVNAIDTFELSDGIHIFVNANEFIPVLTGLGSAVCYPGFLRSHLHSASIDEGASRPKRFLAAERAILKVSYFDTGRRKKDVTATYTFKGKDARPLAEYACLKFREYAS